VNEPEDELPQAYLDFAPETLIFALMRLGFTAKEARDMSPDESERFVAISTAKSPDEPEMVRPGVRKATQADFDRF
jgi:hypothetical protein